MPLQPTACTFSPRLFKVLLSNNGLLDGGNEPRGKVCLQQLKSGDHNTVLGELILNIIFHVTAQFSALCDDLEGAVLRDCVSKYRGRIVVEGIFVRTGVIQVDFNQLVNGRVVLELVVALELRRA